MTLFSEGMDIDKVSVMSKDESLQESFLQELCDSVLTATHAATYAKAVREKAELRRLSSLGAQIDREIESGRKPSEILPTIMDALIGSSVEARSSESSSVSDIFERHVARMSEIAAKRASGEFIGIPTGFTRLDSKVTIDHGKLVFLAARPSVGKSAMALNIAEAAARYGKKVCYFSIEMDEHELMNRLLASVSRISSTKFKYGEVDASALQRCKADLETFQDNLEIVFCPGASSSDILLMAEAKKAVKGLDLVIIDHVDLIRDRQSGSESEATVIGKMTQAFKVFAGRSNVAILALSQFNRESKGGMPELHQLRGSGAKEQDADVVLILHRPDIVDDPEEALLIVRKNRNGSLGQLRLRFHPNLTKFEEELPQPPAQTFENVSWDEAFNPSQ